MNQKNRDIKVFLVRDDPDQKNTAPHNRNLAIEKMIRSSFECELVLPKSTCKRSKNRIVNGLKKRIGLIVEINRCLGKIDDKYDCIIFLRSIDPFTIDPFIALLTWLRSKPKGIKLAIERNEFPYVFFDEKANSFRKNLFRFLILPWHYRLFDLLFLMTDELIDFYGRYSGKKCIIQKLPMTVDFSRFENVLQNRRCSYIFYAGGLSDRKDGVERLIHAFDKISHVYPDIYLKIAGGSNDEIQEKKFLNLINHYHLQDRINLLGYVNREDIPRYLCSAKIVVLPRPDSLQARGGFPTKLGEYLAAGIPVITTRVGEIPRYLLEDEVFFISSDHIEEELINKIKYILSNYQQAKEVAYRGKIAAQKYFSLEVNQKYIAHAFNASFKHKRVI